MSDESLIKKIYSAFFQQEFSADLALMIIWLVLCIEAIYLPFLNEIPVRIVLAIPLVLFIPGYCFIAALFPKDDDIDLLERIALSIGLSIAIVPMVGLGLNFTPWGIRLDPIVISLALFTWVMVLIAHYRRASLPFEERFRIPFSEIAVVIRNEIIPDRSNRVDRLISVVLSIAIIIAIITIVYLITVPREERSSEFYILGEQKTATGYPELIIPEQNYPIYLGVVNHEYRNMTYTIEIWAMHTEFDNVTNISTITFMDPIDRITLSLVHNETKVIPYNLSVKQTGNNRIEFLLFNESITSPDVTGSDRINASYRDLHLIVTSG